MTSYASRRDQVLHTMVELGYAARSGGDAAAPTGAFSVIHVTPQRLSAALAAVDGLPLVTEAHEVGQLCGHFVVVERYGVTVSVVYVDEYASADLAEGRFGRMLRRYRDGLEIPEHISGEVLLAA